MIIETSWDDECPENTRIANLLMKYKLKGTFFIPSAQLDIYNMRKLVGMGFEIGCHSMTHPQDIKLLTMEDKYNEIVKSKEIIEKTVGKEVKHFCYPRGRYDTDCLELVKKANFEDARTVQVLTTSISEAFASPYEKKTTIHFYPRKEYQGESIVDISKRMFKEAKAKGEDGYFHLWGHGWEIEKYNLWKELEEVLAYVYSNSK